MKRFFLLLSFVVFYIISAHAQLAPESFEGSFPPVGWGVYDNGIGTNSSWAQSEFQNDLQPPHTGTYAAYLDRENVPTGLPEDWLVTPSFNLPANAQVRFWSRLTQGNNQGSIYQLRVSTDPVQSHLSSYVVVKQWTENEINPTTFEYLERTVKIPENVAAPGTPVYVAFVMVAAGGDRWLIDDVQVSAGCVEPTDLTATNISLTSAELSWANPGGATAWEIEVVPFGSPATGHGTQVIELPYIVNGLESDNVYRYYVRAVCSNIGGDWVGPYSFSTPVPGSSCNAPTQIVGLPYFSASDSFVGKGLYTSQPGTGCGPVSGSEMSPWYTIYRITPTASATITVQVTPEKNATGLYIYAECSEIGNSCIVGSNALLPLNKSVTFSAQAGEDYFIMVTSPVAENRHFIQVTDQCSVPGFSAEFNIESACNGGAFSAIASVTLGSADSVTVRAIDSNGNDAGLEKVLTSSGIDTFGPFLSTETVNLLVQNTSNPTCTVVSGPLNTILCPPQNDHCSAAAVLEGGTPETSAFVMGNLRGATASAIPGNCPGGDRDVWYTFVASNQKHRIEIEDINGELLDLNHSLYHGSCGSLSLLYCSAENISTATNLVPGQTYYVRVYSESEGQAAVTFNIKTSSYAPNCTDDNPRSANVQELFKDLLNHLLTLDSVPGQGPNGVGYICPQLQALEPYITDPQPRIYNFIRHENVISFSFSNAHGGSNDVTLGPISPLVSEVNLLSYTSPDSLATVSLVLANNVTVGEKRYEVRHINFCPDAPCTPVSGTIKVVGAQSCVPPGNVSFFLDSSDPVEVVFSWAAYNVTTGLLAGSATGSNPTLPLNAPGDYIIKVILNGSNGCKTTIQRFLTVATDCNNRCTEANPVSENIKQLYINLANYLIDHNSSSWPSGPFSCQQLVALSPYINVPNPKIYNFTNYGNIISFSFASTGASQISFPNNGQHIADINLSGYTSTSLQSYATLYANGTQTQMHSIGNINFCPVITCQPLNGDIILASGLSCVQQNKPVTVRFGTLASNVTGWSWTFYATDGQTILHSANGVPQLSYTYTTPGQYDVQVVVTYGNGCTKTVKKTITVSAPGGCTQCTETNPLTPDVKEAYLDLVNHLLSYFLNGFALPYNPQVPFYTCPQLEILVPYISDANPKIWNAAYDASTQVLKFSFSNHGNGFDVMVKASAPLTNIDLLEYVNDNSFEQPISLRSYINSVPATGVHSVRHVMFCPESCPELGGQITLLTGQNCVLPFVPATFAFSGPTNNILKYEWKFFNQGGAVVASVVRTPGSGSLWPMLPFPGGNYSIQLVVHTYSGCKYTYYSGFISSTTCSSCMEQNPQAGIVTNAFRSLVNKLLTAYRSGYTVNNISIASEMSLLQPYITDASPMLSNISYVNHVLSFSFSGAHSQPDVVVYDYGNIATINLSAYSSASQATSAMIVYNNGIVNFGSTVRHLNFCPPEPPCESHIAFVLDESGSISTDNADYIKDQLEEFVRLQRVNNTHLKVTFVSMGDADDKKGPYISKVIAADTAAEAQELINFINNYKKPYIAGANNAPSANSDYWYEALRYAYSLHPELIVVIADGAQTSDVEKLKTLIQTIRNPQSGTHLYVAGLERGYYIDAQTSSTAAYDPNIPGGIPTPGVSMHLTQSLKYLMGLSETQFPVKGKDEIMTRDYYGYEDFQFFADALYYFYNQQIVAGLGCGAQSVPVEVCDDCNAFKPIIGKKYWLSGWVKQEQTVQVKTYEGCAIRVNFLNQDGPMPGISTILEVSGEIIDGWQRVAGPFTIPEGTIDIEIVLDPGPLPAYFDDIRMHPLNGSMKTFVYDPETFRLMAEQDDNNYSTFYEYDKEGGLVRIKKETSRGVKTIQESRSGNYISTE